MRYFLDDKTNEVSFYRRPEYLVNDFTLIFSKVQDGLSSIADVSISVQDTNLLGKCFPVVNFIVDGSQFSSGTWIATLIYNGTAYDSKIIESWNGDPVHKPAGSGVLDSITILNSIT